MVLLTVLSGACGDDGDDMVVTSAPTDPRGYAVEPSSYLGPVQRQALAASRVPVLVPTWLPEWTREIEPVAFVVPTGGYVISWSVSLRSEDDLWHPIVAKLRSGIDVRISGDVSPWSPELPPWPERAGTSGRKYLWDPKNDVCSEGEGGSYEAALLWQPEGRPTVEYTPPPTVAHNDTDEPTDDEEYATSFPPAGHYPYHYRVTLAPSPPCSDGEFAASDMLSFADSIVPLTP